MTFSLKWRMLHQTDEHYIYYCGQESLWRNGVTIIVNKRVWNAVQFSSVHSFSHVRLFATPWITAHQASLSITNSWSSLSTWAQSQKWQINLYSLPRQTIQYHGNPSKCPNQKCWKEAKVEWFYEDLLELTSLKNVLFIIGDWNAKVGSQRYLE